MDTLPLPPRPDIEQYRKRAKSLVAAANSTETDAVRRWATEWLKALTKLLGVEITEFVQGSFNRAVDTLVDSVTRRKAEGNLALADAQHLIAQAHSYENWASFSAEISALQTVSRASAFERAADAVVSGDIGTLSELLKNDPGLVQAHSTRQHHAMLLHYVAANGVEDFRQKTPPNAVEVAKLLLDAGAPVDGLADTYGGGVYQTTMNLLVSSTHPADAGLQSTLAEVLLDYGAAINGLEGHGSPILTALAFGYKDTADTLARRGATIDNVVMAAGVGRLDLVESWVKDTRTLVNHEPYKGPYWVNIPEDATRQIEMALAWACRFARADVAKYLLGVGVSANAQDNNQMTALHWAAATGMVDVMDILLSRGAPLEVRNTWGGTVLDSTCWFVTNAPTEDANYPAVIERLVRAGADVSEVYPPVTGVEQVDAILRAAREHWPPEQH